jgi:hypothetical protein
MKCKCKQYEGLLNKIIGLVENDQGYDEYGCGNRSYLTLGPGTAYKLTNYFNKYIKIKNTKLIKELK